MEQAQEKQICIEGKVWLFDYTVISPACVDF
jgi:hypothetical protein